MFAISDLNTHLPSGALTETSDDVTVSLKGLTGRTTVQLDDTTALVDAIHDLLLGASKAQAAYNTANPTATINSFTAPTFTAPTERPDGKYRSNATFTVITQTELDFSSTRNN